jgi:hypothetical protein
MTFRPLARAIAIAGLSIACAVPAAPAFAGPAEIAMLESYVGSWQGRGQVTGARSETVVCRLTITPANGEKVNYNGRCAAAGTTISVKGTMAYNDQASRFEAAMTSSVGYSGAARGKKQGDGVIFDLQDAAKDEQGNNMQVSASITLTTAEINVNFNVVFLDSGDQFRAAVPFTK